MAGKGFRRRGIPALIGAALLASAACGQKAGVGGPDASAAPAAVAGPAAIAAGPALSPATATGPGPGAAAPLPSRSGPLTSGGGSTAGASGPPTTRPSGPAVAAASSASARTAAAAGVAAAGGPEVSPTSTTGPATVASAAGPHDRDGVSDKEIVIGMHAPLTGAAPIPEDSLEKAKDLYWRFVAEKGGIFGRNVRVVFRDDQFNPSRAVTVCREMVEQEHAMLLVGVGTDQVVSCARYASQAGVPYFSMGGSEAPVAGLRTYFGLTMGFRQQAPLVAQMVRKAGKTKVAVVVINTPNYDDAFAAMAQAARDAGLSVVRTDRMGKQPTQAEVLAEANNLRESGAEAVLLAITPIAFLELAHDAQSQAYTPLWTGPGPANGFNLVAEFGCPSIAGARFLSPFPELDVIDRLDADYRTAYRKYNNGAEADDIGLVVWGLEKTLHQFFLAAGRDLGRARLMAVLDSGREFASGVFPPVHFGPSARFGAAQTHLVEADCANRRYRTLATFASSF